jgi:hypothetical protein
MARRFVRPTLNIHLFNIYPFKGGVQEIRNECGIACLVGRQVDNHHVTTYSYLRMLEKNILEIGF